MTKALEGVTELVLLAVVMLLMTSADSVLVAAATGTLIATVVAGSSVVDSPETERTVQFEVTEVSIRTSTFFFFPDMQVR